MKQIKRNPDVPSYWLSIFERDAIIKLFNFVEVSMGLIIDSLLLMIALILFLLHPCCD